VRRTSAALVALVAACGGGATVTSDASGPDFSDADIVPAADATVPSDARTDCPVPLTFVAPGSAGATAVQAGDGSITMLLDLDAAAMPDRFQLRLVSGRGVFIDGVTTGDFFIGGAQLDNDSCAVCAMVLADVGAGGGSSAPAEKYFAEAGRVELTSVDGQLTGTITDLRFVHVLLGDGPDDEIEILQDGCTTRISSMTFDLAISGP
jgi:hypothetical protein